MSPSGPYAGLKQFGLVVLCAMWVLLGLVGHDPWKTEDATGFGVVWDMRNSHTILTPTLLGETYAERPPLVYVLGVASERLFEPWLEPHDAARLCVALMLGLTLFLLARSGKELGGRAMQWLPPLLFVGSIGLWDRSHQLAPEIGLLLGLAIAQYGFALSARRPRSGGTIVGIGAGVAFLAYGFLGVVWITLAAILLPVLFREWRGRAYGWCALTALAVAVVAIGAWPLLLALSAPSHLAAWWSNQTFATYFAPLSPTGWLDAPFVLKNLPWFTWPAAPLALWTLWTRGRGFNGGLRTPALQVPATLALAVLLALLLMPDARAIHLMMLILPLSLLGALEVDTLKRGLSSALDWFGILTFGLLAAISWGIWWDAYLRGMPPAVARAFRDANPGYQPSFHIREVAVCVFLTVLWLVLVRPARRSNRRAILNWAAGTTLLWAMYTTIWLPYLDSRRSYRVVAENAALHLPNASKGCIASRGLGEPQRALFYYFAGIVTVREEIHPAHGCRALIVQYGAQVDESAVTGGWVRLWQGQRRGDETEHFVIYTRADVPAPLAARR
ncbi:MAG: hypothetical protein M3Z31_03960 [Pseudomonadota bacterium]|nr:hypothetical protein [Pseudomonadota bacterium]